MKEELNKLIKEFEEECKDKDNGWGHPSGVKPSFKNFCRWLDGRTWEME